MISFPPHPIPVVVEGLGDAYIVYIRENGMWDNDEICVALLDGGKWYHVNTQQIRSWHNDTYDIKKAKDEKTTWERITDLRKHFSEWSNNTAEGHDENT